MRRPRRLAVAALALVWASGSWTADARSVRVAKEGLGVGDQPPAFTVLDLKGNRQSLKRYRGRLVVLHFWATWCPYCRREVPKLKELYRKYRTSVKVVTVSTDRDLAQLKRFVRRSAILYPVIPDSKTKPSLAQRYGVRGIPVTYIIARDGRILTRLQGSSDIVGTVKRFLTQRRSSLPRI